MDKRKTHLLPQKSEIPFNLSDTVDYLSVGREDFNLYFSDTFWRFEDSQCWEYIVGTLENAGEKIFVRSKANEGRENQRPIKGIPVSFGFPKTGLYNFKKGVISFRRRTFRQNKKTLCSSTGEIYSSVNLFAGFLPLPQNFLISQMWRWTQANVQSVFGDKSGYSELEDAFESVRKLRTFSRALNRNFFLGQGITSKQPSLWFHQTLIGRCPAKNEIVVSNRAFLQEVIDQFIPAGVSIDVEEESAQSATA